MKFNRRSLFYISGGIGILLVAVFGIRALHTTGPAVSTADANQALLATVGTLITLPADETPVIATVADPAQLQSQPFFKHAQKGDKALLYMKAQKAILYRPIEQKIIEVAPFAPTATP
jgi:hypothetical protein